MIVLRHIAAPLVSFVVSWIVFIPGLFVFGILHFLAFLFALVGFLGVFSGTCCLPRISRRVGSGALLLLGLAFYCYLAKILADSPDDTDGPPTYPMSPFVWCIPLTLGGLLSAFLSWWPPSNHSLQRTAARHCGYDRPASWPPPLSLGG